jgi:hypothetical protein
LRDRTIIVMISKTIMLGVRQNVCTDVQSACGSVQCDELSRHQRALVERQGRVKLIGSDRASIFDGDTYRWRGSSSNAARVFVIRHEQIRVLGSISLRWQPVDTAVPNRTQPTGTP